MRLWRASLVPAGAPQTVRFAEQIKPVALLRPAMPALGRRRTRSVTPTQCLSLLKSPFLLWRLMLRAAMHTLLGDDAGVPVPSPDPANMGAFARRAPARGTG